MLLSTILQALSAAVIFIVFKFSPEHFITLVYSLFMIYILIKAVYAPLEQDHISTYANEENTGMMMGIRQSFFLIGTIIGPVFGGFLYDVNPKLLFNISASLFLISIIFIYISNIYTNKESL